jgi:hypothetical protein
MGQTEQQSGSNLAESKDDESFYVTCFAADRSGNLAFREKELK